MDLSDTAYKVYGHKKPFWKLMDLTETSSQVNGPLVHLTLLKYISSYPNRQLGSLIWIALLEMLLCQTLFAYT